MNLNEHGRTIKAMSGRKGGRRRVKKGFAMATSELQRELVNRRWEKYRAKKEQERLQSIQE